MSKFCGNCGKMLDDDVKVCGYCGTPAITPNVNPMNNTTKQSSGKLKKIVVSMIAVVAIVVGIISFSSVSNEPCDWCGDSPSKAFKTNSGGKAYVCSDCRKECTWCGDKATKHYENYFEMIVFVCNDCYKDLSE